LLGLAECGWLDAKDGVYQLDDPVKSEELVKDVAGFANARTGGLVVVGFSTRKEHQEVVDALRPVPRALVDMDRCRKLIRERVIPPPRGVSGEWIDCGDDKGVLAIDVPAQPVACLPYVVPGPTRTANVSRVSVAVPVREADATPWLPQPEIQRLLAAGWAATGGPSEEFLNGLIEQAVTAASRNQPPPAPDIEIGDGVPGWKGPFQRAWSELMNENVWIGNPATEVYGEGPGVVQHFESHMSLFEPATVLGHLCPLDRVPRRRPCFRASAPPDQSRRRSWRDDAAVSCRTTRIRQLVILSGISAGRIETSRLLALLELGCGTISNDLDFITVTPWRRRVVTRSGT
jgi:hypothetical protein